MNKIILSVLMFILMAVAVNGVACGVVPVDGCTVDGDLTLTTGTYALPNGIVPNCNACTLDCNGATLLGNYTKIRKGE